MLSPDSKCKTFDQSGNGFARSEAVGVIILQKAKHAKRAYVEVVHVKTNSDGYKSTGFTVVSHTDLQKLYEDFYKECQIDPSTLSYVECHGTGIIKININFLVKFKVSAAYKNKRTLILICY